MCRHLCLSPGPVWACPWTHPWTPPTHGRIIHTLQDCSQAYAMPSCVCILPGQYVLVFAGLAECSEDSKISSSRVEWCVRCQKRIDSRMNQMAAARGRSSCNGHKVPLHVRCSGTGVLDWAASSLRPRRSTLGCVRFGVGPPGPVRFRQEPDPPCRGRCRAGEQSASIRAAMVLVHDDLPCNEPADHKPLPSQATR